MTNSSKFDRLLELYRIGGILEVTHAVKDTLLEPVRKKEPYQDTRIDNEERWKFIEDYISDVEVLLDIGCAQGFFTGKAAKKGCLSLGIDRDSERLRDAIERSGFGRNEGYMHMELTPNTIHKLPNTNATLLLAVHHHWENNFGLNDAEKMFQIVMDRSDLVVYEPPGDRPLIYDQKGMLDETASVIYYKSKILSLYGKDVEIIDYKTFQKTKYPKRKAFDGRLDPVFIIDTAEYEHG